MREIVLLECTVCKRRNYSTTVNRQNNKEKLQLNKYCKYCRKHTLHKEVKA
ncbi:MAG: 50S ribosomal protein L33 [Caldiserica bacterium CG02_land_8_20_14_3_00_36_38]|jgi:large subunit ribosomal protein L33|nr:50S ribosomal protein L33 [Caldisericota bacterium]OIP13590.1 MAG: 50S ribosomal protein L33 [Caldisericum sp. CG2_30_36_11]PIP50106.1 MAG: 50S ribosomal protein L33 [Caldiserica bacterium CG23_combo_of_CG06-09_8_20_14_all_35_60]PIV55003.1 MAG: 50S ribosomal protein L33 [Caldiserica bacterium CG02_land_8_20_14_3_00_36_38]PIW10956.1 MAG: 50S ribosomal protein L33 [Caldiserica bacterium CG17_big_fil_post_rev_8_21_14_2_50_35_7]PIX28454.1 MAG: 50S ribosomal protein L33 [Caldiserica bacterium CG